MRRRRVTADLTGNVVAVSEDTPVDEHPDEHPDERFDDGFDELIADEPVPDEAASAPRAAAGARLGSVRWELPDPTGVQAVDDALAPLLELDDLPTGEHVAHYETVHRRLQDALADLDSA